MQTIQGRRTLRRTQVIQKTGISQATIFRLEKAGDFPRHFLLSPRCAVWFEDEIDAWLEDRQAKAIAAAPATDALVRRWSKGEARAAA